MRYYHSEEIPKDFSGYCYIESTQEHQWRLNGKLHRLDGPAVIYDSGTEVWYKHGMFHRLDGPACKLKNGDDFRCEYWINGVNYSVESYWNHPLVAEYKLKSILEDKGS